ncbi:hypothetical protein [Cryptosporangium sp. NPDC048952]|uniref:hypothetical protein n=1 Tax=Cryptosporangium sp. NPDC048952 TaxID=3363961 RepID=UPI0037195BB1
MTSLLDYLRSTETGSAALSDARLRYDVLVALRAACRSVSEDELAARLGIARWRVQRTLANDGNVSIKKLARYLNAAGYELKVELVSLERADETAFGAQPGGVEGQIALELPQAATS